MKKKTFQEKKSMHPLTVSRNRYILEMLAAPPKKKRRLIV